MSERLKQFMAKVAADTYPEPVTEGHADITRRVLEDLIPKLPEGAEVLDVGCGQGVALKIFKEHGIWAIGIGVNAEDLEACYKQGFDVTELDQNDIDWDDSDFDLVWARHVLEHSIAPYWTLHEFKRVLRSGGLLYVEVPAPDTACCHERNQNHYSVLGHRAWECLIERAGFTIEEAKVISVRTGAGPDMYWSFLCRKR